MSFRAPLIRSSFGLAFSRGVSGALIVVASVVVARSAGASALGVFGLALTVGLYASIIADAGIWAYLVPELGRAPRERWSAIWADVVHFELRSAVPLAGVYVLVVALLVHGPYRSALILAAPWWLLLRFNIAARSVFTVSERVGAEALATITDGATALFVIVLIATASQSSSLPVLGLAAGAAVGLAIRLRGLRALGVRGGRSGRRARDTARAALPFAAFTILTTVYLRIDVVLLSLLADARSVGLYQPAVRLGAALIILPDAVSTVLLGRSARAPDDRAVKRRQEQLLTVGLPLGVVLTVLVAFVGKPFLGLLYGHEFRQSWLALTLLTATVPAALLTGLNGNALTARGLQRARVVCLVLASVLAVAAAIPAILLWGYNGAAGVSLVNEVFLAAAYSVALTTLVGRRALVLPRPRLSG
jgi:O-antigen/teichoic acid export membrane protein